MTPSEPIDRTPGAPGCPGCSGCSAPPQGTGPENVLVGRRLALASAGVLLVPLGLALTGAVLAGPAPLGGWLGGMTGFALGLVVTAGLAKMLFGGRPQEPDAGPGCPKDHQENRL